MTKRDPIIVIFSLIILAGLISVSDAKEKAESTRHSEPAKDSMAGEESQDGILRPLHFVQGPQDDAALTKEDENFLNEGEEGIAGEASPEEALPEPPAPPTVWEQYPPDIQVFMWGEQFRIQVTINPEMPKDKVGGVTSIKLEKTDGTFLGYRPFDAVEPRQAIFMTDPNKIEITEAKVTIISGTDEEWSKIISMENPASAVVPITPPSPAGAKAAPPESDKGKEKGKKKFGLW